MALWQMLCSSRRVVSQFLIANVSTYVCIETVRRRKKAFISFSRRIPRHFQYSDNSATVANLKSVLIYFPHLHITVIRGILLLHIVFNVRAWRNVTREFGLVQEALFKFCHYKIS